MFTRKKPRKAKWERKSKETQISAQINIDGQGDSSIQTGIGILDHMLELFTFHGFIDLNLEVKKSDTNIDIHHTNEDIGIVLGKVLKDALGSRDKIRRFGFGAAPMESTFSEIVLDLSGRGYFKMNIEGEYSNKAQEGYDLTYLEHFMESLAHNLGSNIIITIKNPSDDLHTNLESAFKAFGLALDQATQIDPRREGIPSTKGIID